MSHIASVAARRATIEQRALVELAKLSPPAKVARDWRKVIAYTRQTLRQAVKLEEAARSNDAAEVSSQKVSSSRAQLQLLVAAARAGLRHCSVVA
jgi:hypothetical protein